MKRILILVTYWIVAIFVTALMLLGLDYGIDRALMMSLAFLPCAMALSFFLPKVDRSKSWRDRLLDSIFIVLGVMTAAFMLLFIVQALIVLILEQGSYFELDIPAMLRNPFFIAIVLGMLSLVHYLLEKWLDKRFPSATPVTFTSDYRKVSLMKEDILYIESRDSEVLVFARDGRIYRNFTGITQWENLLGDGFLRIHRAFLVNISAVTLTSPDAITVATASPDTVTVADSSSSRQYPIVKELPVSRKYKDTVRAILKP